MAIYYNGAHAIRFGRFDMNVTNWKNHLTDINRISTNDPPNPHYEGFNWPQSIDTHSWNDLCLVPSSRPYIDTPKPRLQFVTLPRSNRILDLSTSLSNDITYEAREGDWEFYVDHDGWDDWSSAYNVLCEYFDGSNFIIELSDHSEVSYFGKLFIGNYKVGDDYSTVSIHYDIDAGSQLFDDTIIY